MSKALHVSVVTVVKDDAAGIVETGRMIAAQTCRSYEWIVIDGASTDGTVDEIDRMHRAGLVSSYVSEADGGVYSAMNKGLALANGEVVLFQNAGDVLASDHVLLGIEHSHRLEGWMWACGSLVRTSSNGQRRRPVPPKWNRMSAAMKRPPQIHPATVMARSLLVGLGGFREEYRVAADVDLMLRAMRQGVEPRLFNETWVEFHLGGLSSSAWMTAMREYAHIRRDVLDLRGPMRVVDEAQTWSGFVATYMRILAGRKLAARYERRNRTA